jgi:adenylosuccinate lyase
LVVRQERMRENIERGLGLHASSRLLTALLESGGMSREDAYAIVQRNALRAADERRQFRDLVEADPQVQEALSTDELADCFDDAALLRHVDTILGRLDQLATQQEAAHVH